MHRFAGYVTGNVKFVQVQEGTISFNSTEVSGSFTPLVVRQSFSNLCAFLPLVCCTQWSRLRTWPHADAAQRILFFDCLLCSVVRHCFSLAIIARETAPRLDAIFLFRSFWTIEDECGNSSFAFAVKRFIRMKSLLN